MLRHTFLSTLQNFTARKLQKTVELIWLVRSRLVMQKSHAVIELIRKIISKKKVRTLPYKSEINQQRNKFQIIKTNVVLTKKKDCFSLFLNITTTLSAMNPIFSSILR